MAIRNINDDTTLAYLLKKTREDIRPVRVLISKSVTLTANNNNANKVDFTSEIASNRPSGKKFKRLEFLGAWPGSTWTNAIVTRCFRASTENETFLELATMQTQTYAVRAVAVYE